MYTRRRGKHARLWDSHNNMKTFLQTAFSASVCDASNTMSAAKDADEIVTLKRHASLIKYIISLGLIAFFLLCMNKFVLFYCNGHMINYLFE
jgi:hypothetical protein